MLSAPLALLAGPGAWAREAPGADSPQALVERMRAAAAAEDFGEIAACIAPAERAQMALGLVAGTGMMVAFMGLGGGMAMGMAEGMTEGLTGEQMSEEQKAEMEKGRKEMEEKAAKLQGEWEGILKKHGLGDLLSEQGGLGAAMGEGSSPEAAQELLAGVDDIALMEDLMAFFKGLGEGMPGEKKEPLELPGEVTDYRIEGDHATARSGDEVVEFVEVDGRWYFKPAEGAAQE